jgi:hypothetical protein
MDGSLRGIGPSAAGPRRRWKVVRPGWRRPEGGAAGMGAGGTSGGGAGPGEMWCGWGGVEWRVGSEVGEGDVGVG